MASLHIHSSPGSKNLRLQGSKFKSAKVLPSGFKSSILQPSKVGGVKPTPSKTAKPICCSSPHPKYPTRTPSPSRCAHGSGPEAGLGTSSFVRLSPISWSAGSRGSGSVSALATGQGQTAAGPKPAIEVRDLVVHRGGKEVIRSCSLTIPEGQLWMLLGPNGCGKSTMLKVMAGLLPFSSGSVKVKLPRSFVFQNPDHQVVLPTVRADVAFGLGSSTSASASALSAAEVARRVEESLAAVSMEQFADRSVQTLSGGQKQRVAIAGALAEQAQLLLLDELTTFLDETDQLGVIKAVRNVVDKKKGVTALWVTHRLEEMSFADGAIYMSDGRVIMWGEANVVREFIKKQQETYVNSQSYMS